MTRKKRGRGTRTRPKSSLLPRPPSPSLPSNREAYWVEQGPGPLAMPVPGYSKAAGAVQAIAADPTNRERVFVATVGGGIWLSNDAASAKSPHWTPQSDFASSLSMSSIALSPLDPNHGTLYAGCAQTSHAAPFVGPSVGPLIGILKTTDGGLSWNDPSNGFFQSQSIMKILAPGVAINNEEIVLVGTAGGLYRSVDSGRTWVQIGIGKITPPVTDIVANPGSPKTIYVAAGGQILRSNDAGDQDWTNITPLSWANKNIPPWITIKISVSPVKDLLGHYWIYAAAGGEWYRITDGSSLVFSNDDGMTWTQMGNTPDGHFPCGPIVASPLLYDAVFCVTDAGTWFPNVALGTHWMGTVQQDKTTVDWTVVEGDGANQTSPHADSRDLQFSADPNVLYESNDGGIYRLINPHGTAAIPRRWEEAVGDIRITEFHSIAYDSTNHVIFGAAQDNSIPQQSFPGDIDWEMNENPSSDGFQVGVDVKSTPGAAIHYSSQQFLFNFVRRTYTTPTTVTSAIGIDPIINGTGGEHYNGVEGALNPGTLGTVRWNQSWIVNRADPSRLLLGTNYLYESRDHADTFDSLGGLGKNKGGDWMPINPVGTVMAYAYGHANNNDVIYLSAGGKLLLRTAGAGLPTVIGRNNPNDPNDPGTYPGSSPWGIVLSEADWRTAYVLDSQARVWRTTDAGKTSNGWDELTGNLHQLSSDLRSIELIRSEKIAAGEAIFVGGFGGVFICQNPEARQLASWQKHGANMPNAIVTDIHYDPGDDILVAGTLGRSAWSITSTSKTIGVPRLEIIAAVKVGTNIDNQPVNFFASISRIANLTKPLDYEWTVQGGNLASPLNGEEITIIMPGQGNLVQIKLTVTDQTGYQMVASLQI